MGTTERSTNIATPWKAFALVLTVAAIATTTIYFLTSPGSEVASSNDPAGQSELRTASAEEAFLRLDQLRERAYENRDTSLIDDFLAINSPLRERARKEIERLRQDDVLVEIDSTQKSLEVVLAGRRRATIEQVVTQRVRFVSEEGEDVTDESTTSTRTIRWDLVYQGSDWRIFDSELVDV